VKTAMIPVSRLLTHVLLSRTVVGARRKRDPSAQENPEVKLASQVVRKRLHGRLAEAPIVTSVTDLPPFGAATALPDASAKTSTRIAVAPS
jgi:hypothetical protein